MKERTKPSSASRNGFATARPLAVLLILLAMFWAALLYAMLG